jgi:hypothetical protein
MVGYSSGNSTFINNTVSSPFYSYGFFFTTSSAITMVNNTVNGTSAGNVYILNTTGTRITGDHYWGYAQLINITSASSPPLTINMTGVAIDSPSGNYSNYTLISLNDACGTNESFAISWSNGASPLPGNRLSFAKKYVYITGNTSIDSISWSWLNSELGNYKERSFELWRYNASGWALLNSTPDTSGNNLSLTDLAPGSVYGILANNSCPVVNESGAFTMVGNLVGAPNPSPDIPFFGGSACVIINAQNVLFDCNGYNITGNGTASIAYGILLNNTRNVTVRNCPAISSYNHSVYIYASNNSLFVNDSVMNTAQNG